jgi:hypothetical protein
MFLAHRPPAEGPNSANSILCRNIQSTGLGIGGGIEIKQQGCDDSDYECR